MKNWVISYILALGLQLSVYAGDENIRAFRTVDPLQLEKKVPPGYGHVFLQAGRQYNIDPVVLAAVIFSLSKTLALSGHLPNRIDTAFEFTFFAFAIVAVVTRSEWFHKLLAPAFGLLFAVYIALLFARL